MPDLAVTGIDFSDQALRVAKVNARLNHVDIQWMQNDFLNEMHQKFDYIVCNPPYVAVEEYSSLQKEVLEYEPKMALVAEEEGLAFYQRLASDAPRCLNPGGKIFLEIGSGQKEALLKLFFDKKWKRCQSFLDWSGKDRFFFLEIE